MGVTIIISNDPIDATLVLTCSVFDVHPLATSIYWKPLERHIDKVLTAESKK